MILQSDDDDDDDVSFALDIDKYYKPDLVISNMTDYSYFYPMFDLNSILFTIDQSTILNESRLQNITVVWRREGYFGSMATNDTIITIK